MHLYSTQQDAGNEIVDKFSAVGNLAWAILSAPPQSGKTGVLLYVACEMCRRGQTRTIVFTNGHADNQLKAQATSDAYSFIDNAYDAYLKNTIKMNQADRCKLKATLARAFVFLFGHDLTNSSKLDSIDLSSHVIVVHDESHAAQDVGMRPHKFFQRLGISMATGEVDPTRNIWVVSASATGISENLGASATGGVEDFENQHEHEQVAVAKYYIKLKPGPGFTNISGLIKRPNTFGFDDPAIGLNVACEYEIQLNREPTYSIVRVRNTAEEAIARRIGESNGFKCVAFNGKTKEIANLNMLKYRPGVRTLIIIKGLMRMGYVLMKLYLGFIFESAKNSNTDTVTQGLLGRMNGYISVTGVAVYIHNNILNSADLERACNHAENDYDPSMMPHKASNVIAPKQTDQKKLHALHQIAPIFMSREQLNDAFAFSLLNKEPLIASCGAAMHSNAFNGGSNGDVQLLEIKEKFEQYILTSQESNSSAAFTVRTISHNVKTYSGIPKKYNDCVQSGIPDCNTTAAGCGVGDNEIVIYKLMDSYPEFNLSRGGVIIDFRIAKKHQGLAELERGCESSLFSCKVNNKSAFCVSRAIRDGTCGAPENPAANRARVLRESIASTPHIPPATSQSIFDMTIAIYDLVANSVNHGAPRKVTSNAPDCEKIVVNDIVLAAISRNGEIYSRIKREFNVQIVAKKQRGQRSKHYIDIAMYVLTEISW